MTVYYAKPYMVGGLYTHGGDLEVHYDSVPDSVKRVWEIDPVPAGDTRPWVRGGDGFWSMPGEDGGLELSWDELLDDFGPLSDDEDDAAIGIEALEARYRAAEMSPTSRYELGAQWSRKGRLWSRWVYLLGGVLVGNFVSMLVIDRTFPWPVTLAIIVGELGAAVRSRRCFSRARRIWNGEVSA